MNNHFSVLVKRYLLASIIVLTGIVMIILGFSTHQDGLFMLAAVNLLIGGALAILFSAGILSKNIVLIIGFVCIATAVFVGFKTKDSVAVTIQHEKDYTKAERLNQYVLGQIRDIQRAYRTENGVYAPNFDALADFFENDKIQKIDASGTVPGRKLTIPERDFLYKDKRALDQNMTEREAALLVAGGNPDNASDLAKFRRDTVQVLFKNEFLSSRTRQSQREALGLGEFNINELRYIPMTDPKEEWTFETRDQVPYLKGDTIATVHVYGKSAISKFEGGDRGVVGFGNLKTNSDKGTWE